MKITNLAFKVGTALSYPFVLIFIGVPIWIFLLILMLISLDTHGKDNDYLEFKHALTPKRYLLTVWQLTADKVKECNQEMKETWPIFIALLIISFLPLTVSLMFGWC